MRLHSIRWLFAIVAGVFAVALSTTIFLNRAGAQESETGNGLRITPVRQELTLAAGQNDSYEIEVTNVTTGEINVLALVNDFESDDQSGQPRLLVNNEEPSPFSLVKFVALPESFLLKPDEGKKVTIQIDVPDNIAPGGYFGVVRFAAGLEGQDPGTIALTASVGSLLLISVPGEVQEGMELNFIEARKGGKSSAFFESIPDVLAISLENTGNSILKPYGQVSVKNMFGQDVYSYELNSSQVRSNVLPKSSRVFEDPLFNIGRVGRYTIEANLSYGEGGGNLITASSSFWVIPWRLLLLGLLLVAAIVWFATKGIKIYNRKIVERAKKSRT